MGTTALPTSICDGVFQQPSVEDSAVTTLRTWVSQAKKRQEFHSLHLLCSIRRHTRRHWPWIAAEQPLLMSTSLRGHHVPISNARQRWCVCVFQREGHLEAAMLDRVRWGDEKVEWGWCLTLASRWCTQALSLQAVRSPCVQACTRCTAETRWQALPPPAKRWPGRRRHTWPAAWA